MVRSGPECEFALCPAPENQDLIPGDNEKVLVDSVQGVEFLYADPFPASFITPQAWPPNVTVSEEEFSCQIGGSEVELAGKIEQKTLGGSTYCRTTQSEGAAGSTYTTYTYEVVKNEKLITVDFVLRLVQCQNYDDPQQTACTDERDTFDPDILVIRLSESLQFVE